MELAVDRQRVALVNTGYATAAAIVTALTGKDKALKALSKTKTSRGGSETMRQLGGVLDELHRQMAAGE